MDQKGRKMRSGTAPELPKWVRGASGAPPDDENGVQKQEKNGTSKKAQKRRSKGRLPHRIWGKKGSKKEVKIMEKREKR